MIDLEAVQYAANDYVIRRAHPGGRSLSLDACRLLGQLVALVRPRRVLEFGSGFSSLVIADELGRQKTGRLDSIDHSPAWSARARLLAAEGVGRAEFHVFALRLRRYPGLPCVFYAIPDGFHRRRGPWDLVFVDGPGHEVGRDGAMPEIFDHLAPAGFAVLDDCNAAHMTRTVARWRKRFGPALDFAYLPDVGNGFGVIEKRGDMSPTPSTGRGGSLRDWVRAVRSLIRVWGLDLNAGAFTR